MADLRLLPFYVNPLFILFYYAMLHNQHLQAVGGDVVITYIIAVLEIWRFGISVLSIVNQ